MILAVIKKWSGRFCFIFSGLFSIKYTRCCLCACLHARVLMHHLVKVNILSYLFIPREEEISNYLAHYLVEL